MADIVTKFEKKNPGSKDIFIFLGAGQVESLNM